MDNNLIKLHNRIVDISYKHKLSHLSSCLTSLPIIYDVYNQAGPDKKAIKFILSNGHAGLAQYVVLEHFLGTDAEVLLDKHGIHPCIDYDNHILCSTGSLGLGLPIAVGHALSDPLHDVYCLISDGETFEGSIWESLSFIDLHKINNLHVLVNMNGYSAYDDVNTHKLSKKLSAFLPRTIIYNTRSILDDIPFLGEKGIESHYYVLRTEEERDKLLK